MGLEAGDEGGTLFGLALCQEATARWRFAQGERGTTTYLAQPFLLHTTGNSGFLAKLAHVGDRCPHILFVLFNTRHFCSQHQRGEENCAAARQWVEETQLLPRAIIEVTSIAGNVAKKMAEQLIGLAAIASRRRQLGR